MQQIKPANHRHYIPRLLFKFFFVFVLLFINSFSFPHTLLPDIGKYTHSFFETLATWSAKHIFHIHDAYTSRLISDSTGFYINAANLIFIAVIISILWTLLDKNRRNYAVLHYWFRVILSYYLALQLFTYGFSKIFKWQFYLPEPNTLYTTIGNVPPDLLYWSVMGTSRLYTVFTGITEVVAAALLLFKRTRSASGFVAAALLLNVVMINFSFDISVKLYSCFLLLISLLIAIPAFKTIWNIVARDKSIVAYNQMPKYTSQTFRLYAIIKIFVIGLILSDVLLPYFKTKNFNDDAAARPMFHGAYEVTTFIKNNDTLPPLLTDVYRWKKMFIHRRGYLIIQGMNDEMQSYDLEYDTSSQRLLIKKFDDSVQTYLHYRRLNDSTLFLSGEMNSGSIQVYLKKIELNKLPLLQKGFHWTIDQ